MALVNNAALLLSLSIIYEIGYIFRIRNTRLSQLLNGLLIGLIGIAAMSMSYVLAPGLVFDTRSVLISVAALTFGFIPGCVAAAVTVIYRVSMGGVGMPMGVMVIASACALGLVWRHFVGTGKSPFRWLKLYLFGICVHAIMLACTFLLPPEAAVRTLFQIALPVMAIYPVVVVLLSLLLLHQIEFKKAQANAIEAESRYKSLFYNSNAVMLIIDPADGRIVDASPASAEFYGWPVDAIKTMNISQINILTPAEIKSEMENSLNFKRNYFQFKHRRKNGALIDVEVYTGPIDFGGRQLLYSIVHDITERSTALKALQESETRFRTLVNSAPDAIFEVKDHLFTFVNEAGLKLLGAQTPEDLIGRDALDVIHPDYRSEALDYMRDLNNDSLQPHSAERVYIRLDGSAVDVEAIAAYIPYGGTASTLVIARDISERKAALIALQESEERFRTFVDNAPEAIFVLIDRKFTFVNKAGIRLLGATGADQILGKSGLSVIHPDYHDSVHTYMDALHQNRISPMPEERAYIRFDGSLVYVDATVTMIRYGNVLGDLVFARDITERKQHEQRARELEAQLRQQQKLEAIGTLAGGVAHEINNPLNGIMNYAQLILDGAEKGSAAADYSREIVLETERISAIVKNLLQFSRQEKQTHSYASIYDIVGQTVSLVKTIIRKDQIALDIQLDEGLPDIKCRSQQIQQVIMNLLTNARDAVNEKYPDYDENKIIRLRCSEFQSQGRRWLRLTVFDTGCGIPGDLRDRIFDPFFSTKPKENGTGLGLSISYGIVSEHHGRISFESESGKYTMFILELPVDNGWSL
jgi:PAS domain S-box-containing protein